MIKKTTKVSNIFWFNYDLSVIYRVEEVPPSSYFPHNVTSCYWAKMAAVGESAPSVPRNVVIKTEPEPEADVISSPMDVPVVRNPVVSLSSPVSGPQPLCWSEDHRLAVCTSGSLTVLELVCDIHSNKQDLTLHRTSIPATKETHILRVNEFKYVTNITSNCA